jgi:hypothetical protein
MANYTLTYSPALEGWTSFHSYFPEWMEHMNSFMYTFKNGEMWKHNTNATRNRWYNVNYPSTITVILNDAPAETKMFKTLYYDSDHKWSASVITDLSAGSMASSYFEEKEGGYFTYIRRNPDTIDFKALSTQGIGKVALATIAPGTGYLSVFFAFEIPNSISVFDVPIPPILPSGGDVLYVVDAITSVVKLIGNVDEIINDPSSGNRIVVKIPANTVNTNDFAYVIKNAVAESYGARGYYMETTLTNTDTEAVELFAISSQIFKSYP